MGLAEFGGNPNIYTGQITLNGTVQQIIAPVLDKTRRVVINNGSGVAIAVGPPVQPANSPTPGAALSATNGLVIPIGTLNTQVLGPRNNGLSVIGASGTISYLVETT